MRLGGLKKNLNMLDWHFENSIFNFCRQVATDALGADHTKTEYESSPLCRQNNCQLEIEFMKFQVKINPQNFRK